MWYDANNGEFNSAKDVVRLFYKQREPKRTAAEDVYPTLNHYNSKLEDELTARGGVVLRLFLTVVLAV